MKAAVWTKYGPPDGLHELQPELARLSSRSTHVYAEQSGHFIQPDEPDLVIDAVRQVVAIARGE